MSEKIRKLMSGEQGFTLVEMMVVLIIIAVLIGAGIRAYMGYIGRAKITKATGDISTMAAALDSYYQTQPDQGYPNDNNGGQTALSAAGITSTQCAYENPAVGIPYVYYPMPGVAAAAGQGYFLESNGTLDGTNYVMASGGYIATGQSGSAYTIPTTALPAT